MPETTRTGTALRLQALTLPVSDPSPVAKVYRWALEMKPSADDEVEGRTVLGWGNEDRVALVDATEIDDAVEAVTLRMPAMPLAETATWLAERHLAPVAAVVAPEDASAANETWPDAAVAAAADETVFNRTVVSVEGPAEPRLDLLFPLPKEVLAPRNRMGPFTWRSRDWSGLEIPGLLGVTTGAPDPDAMRAFLDGLGIATMGDEPGTPLAVGDHQWILERREPAGIYGFAIVVRVERIKELARTLEHLEIEHRHERNRILVGDPAGRVVLVHGVHGG